MEILCIEAMEPLIKTVRMVKQSFSREIMQNDFTETKQSVDGT